MSSLPNFDMDHISICICTFHRAQMLERLLRSLRLQETKGMFAVSVVVVDNDKYGSAKETVERIATESEIAIQYDIEPEQIIPAARNRALKIARGNFIAIIDDDEFAPRQWLISLYRAILRFDADGALGPVYPFFNERPPRWLIEGRFCERPVIKTGTLLDWKDTRTGNVLLKRAVFDKHNIHFDLKWKTSGSDKAFFQEAMASGCRFIAVEEAPVYETVPPDRWKTAYFFKRALVQGYNTYRYNDVHISRLHKMLTSLRLATLSGAYLVALPFSLVLGKRFVVRCVERGGHHLSQLLGMFGIELLKKRDF